MPRDFKSYINENKTNEKIISENKEQATQYEQIINKYKDMSQSDLMSNLFSEASKLKNEGKLDNNTLNNLKSTLSPFLNDEQNTMLNNLISAIKNEQ